LKPLTLQLARVKDLQIPEFGSLQAWEARAHAAARVNGDSHANDSSKSSQAQGYGGTPMPYFGDPKVCLLYVLPVTTSSLFADSYPLLIYMFSAMDCKASGRLALNNNPHLNPRLILKYISRYITIK